jgi:hypothetical protein
VVVPVVVVGHGGGGEDHKHRDHQADYSENHLGASHESATS